MAAELTVAARPDSGVRLCTELLDQAFAQTGNDRLISTDSQVLRRQQIRRRVTSEAKFLQARGVGPETLVAIKFPPSLDGLIAILAVLYTGAGYLPIDPRHGESSANKILKAARPDLLLTPRGGFDLRSEIDLSEAAPAPRFGSESIAYVATTSGATGAPKSTVIEQGGFVNNISAMIDLLALGPDDVVLQIAPPSAGAAIWQNTAPLIAGARLHIANPQQRMIPRALWQVLIAEQATTVQMVPAMLRLMLDCAPPRSQLGLRNVISAGEILPPDVANRWFETFGDIPLINIYESTECSGGVAAHVLTGAVDASEPVPIGRPLAGATMTVLNSNGTIAASGSVGELQVRGLQVARGYRNDPEQTDQSFGLMVAESGTVRTFKTGDLVTENDDGLLRLVGRVDSQVVVQGKLVALAKIEAALCMIPAVSAAVVTAFGDNSKNLAAHVECSDQGFDQRETLEWQTFLAEHLPDALIPVAYLPYPALPLCGAGKVDRDALRQPGPRDLPCHPNEFRASVAELELVVAAIWAQTLDLPDVDFDADFFDLGGTSLLAVVCSERLRHMGLRVPVGALAEHRTVTELSRAITSSEPKPRPHRESPIGIVTLSKGEGEGPPLFLCLDQANQPLSLVELGRRLGHTGPVYAITQSRLLEHDPRPLQMSELASAASQAIRSLHPTESYYLGGIAVGGDMAWAIANKLEDSGCDVVSVLLVQSARTGVYPNYPVGAARFGRRLAHLKQRASAERKTIRRLSPTERHAYIHHRMWAPARAKVTDPIERWAEATPLLRSLNRRKPRDDQHLWAEANWSVDEAWRPSAISAPVTIMRTSEQVPFAAVDPYLGWDGVATGQTRTVEIDGSRFNFLQMPTVAVFAAAIRSAMEEDLAAFLGQGQSSV